MVEDWWSMAGSAGLVVGMSIWNVPAQHHAVLNHKLAKSESSAEIPTLRYKRRASPSQIPFPTPTQRSLS